MSAVLLAALLTVPISAADYTAAGAPGNIESGSVFDSFFKDASSCYGRPAGPTCYRSRGLRPPTDWKILRFDKFEGPTFDFHYDTACCDTWDRDSDWGLENATLVTFYGHGDPRGWYARGTLDPSRTAPRKVSICQSSLGDFRTRYFWLFSCNVFAHGAAEDASNYKFPGSFHDLCNPLSSSGANCEDVFSRWGARAFQSKKTPANPNLRMACGGSTAIGASPENFAPIWHRLYVEQSRISSAFLLGLYHDEAGNWQVPLCLSLGKDGTDLPMATDVTFLEDPNPAAADPDRLFISYPENRISVAVEDSLFAWKSTPIVLPSVKLPLRSDLFLLPFDPEAAVDRFGSKRILKPQLAGLESLTLLRTDPNAQFYQNLKSGALIATGESNDVARYLATDPEIEDKLLSIIDGLRRQSALETLEAVATTTIVRRDVILRLDSESLEGIHTSPQKAFESLRRENLCRFAEATFSLQGIPLNSLGARATIWACPRSEDETPSGTPHWRGAGNWGLSVRLPFLSQPGQPNLLDPVDILAAAKARLKELEPELAPTFSEVTWRPQIELGTFNCRQEQAYLQIVVKFSSPSRPDLPTYTFEIPAQIPSPGASFEDLRSCSPGEEEKDD